MRRTLEWLVLSLIGTVALAIPFAEVPARLRAFVLVNAAYGAAAGWGMAWLARWNGCPSGRRLVWLCGLLILTGELAATYAHWRRESESAAKRFVAALPAIRNDAERATAARRTLESGMPPQDESARTLYDEQVRRLLAAELAEAAARREVEDLHQFRGYLRQRVRPLGTWRTPWPELFWAGELLVGFGAGAVIFRRAQSRDTSPDPIATVDPSAPSPPEQVG